MENEKALPDTSAECVHPSSCSFVSRKHKNAAEVHPHIFVYNHHAINFADNYFYPKTQQQIAEEESYRACSKICSGFASSVRYRFLIGKRVESN